ncbi:hypothetical protein CI610_03321 [invertebrate metagenome]|uniref:Uncharacterized protein n=1 Tax=invertebrate metagenome TaxID=1711999 RepID=A0A2H9T3E8_9ZZZZ
MVNDAAINQLSLLDRTELDRTEEAQSYHDNRYGYFSLLYGSKTTKRQRSYRLTDMARVLPLVDRDRDTWMSQAEFIVPNRRVVNLARIGLLMECLPEKDCRCPGLFRG